MISTMLYIIFHLDLNTHPASPLMNTPTSDPEHDERVWMDGWFSPDSEERSVLFITLSQIKYIVAF